MRHKKIVGNYAMIKLLAMYGYAEIHRCLMHCYISVKYPGGRSTIRSQGDTTRDLVGLILVLLLKI